MKRILDSVRGNSQKLDGGAMFGNAPRALWSQWMPPDDLDRIDLACRALLVREPDRVLLFETGIGAFFPPKLRERYGVQEDSHVLLENLAALGIEESDVDVVVLSHLHFDHAGGLLTEWQEDAEPALCFPRARYVVGRGAWERARMPHPRDRASFIRDLPALLEESGRLEVVEATSSEVLGPDYKLHRSDGHTPGMLLTEIPGENGPLVFVADLAPGLPWVRTTITMGYDRNPELLIDEKTRLFEAVHERHGRLFFTHDPKHAVCGLAHDDRGRIIPYEPQGELTAHEL